MRTPVAKMLVAAFVIVPLTIISARAQGGFDQDISAYAQELESRIQYGRDSGRLSESSYNSLRNLWNQIDFIGRQFQNRKMNNSERATMMASLMNLDKQLTRDLHDNENARYQDWDNNSRSWRRSWWKQRDYNRGFNEEIDSYQRNLRRRIDNGRNSGRLTPGQYNAFNSLYGNIDKLQHKYSRDGFSNVERNALMIKLTKLDENITRRLHDDDNSRYRYWNSKNNNWNQSWWKPGWKSGSQSRGHSGGHYHGSSSGSQSRGHSGGYHHGSSSGSQSRGHSGGYHHGSSSGSQSRDYSGGHHHGSSSSRSAGSSSTSAPSSSTSDVQYNQHSKWKKSDESDKKRHHGHKSHKDD